MADQVKKDMIDKAMQVDLLAYAQSLGMQFESRGSKDTLYLIGSSFNITRSKNMYYRFSTGLGGNVIQFAMEMNGYSFQEAVRALCGDEVQQKVPSHKYSYDSTVKENTKKEKMILPAANQNAKRAFAYLVKTRHIDSEIVSQLMKERKIYENDKHSCVFVGYDEKGQPGYASVRSTYTMGKTYRGDVRNSNKEFSFTLNGNSDSVFVFEAPIDAMSHASIVKNCGGDWKEDWRISLGGVSDLGLAKFLKSHSEIRNIYFCTDNDAQGNQVLENEYKPDGSIKKPGYMAKYSELGYNVYRDKSKNKDFNEDLKEILDIESQQVEMVEEGMEL